jgi:DNA-directed RNA polymerase specialized sigma24 family protein
MARIDEIDGLLWLWMEELKVGDGSGYPTKSTLHEDWSPPSPGVTPTMKVSRGGSCGIGALVVKLPASLRATLAAKYYLRMTDREAAAALSCAEATVGQRIVRAHQLLAGMMEKPASVFATTD